MNLQNFLSDVLTNGGASFNITTGVYNPNQGFFVSVPSRETQLQISNFDNETLLKFLLDNNDLLSNESYFLGGWVENGVVYLDVANKFLTKELH